MGGDSPEDQWTSPLSFTLKKRFDKLALVNIIS